MMTGELTTIARPYASAAFEYALAHHVLPEWEGMLRSAAMMVQDARIKALLNSPHVTSKQLSDLCCDILSTCMDDKKRHFIQILAENKRLPVLKAIALLFVEYRANQEKTMTVHVFSAVPLDMPYQEKLVKNLTNRLQRQVSLQCEVDPTLIGGAIIRAGDRVIDGSVRGKLHRLLESF